jgi:hypothetical protein
LAHWFSTATRSAGPKDDEEVGFLFEGPFWSRPIEQLDGVASSLTTSECLYVDLKQLLEMTQELYTRYEATFEANESVSLAMIRELVHS